MKLTERARRYAGQTFRGPSSAPSPTASSPPTARSLTTDAGAGTTLEDLGRWVTRQPAGTQFTGLIPHPSDQQSSISVTWSMSLRMWPERCDALRKAWALTGRALIVSARLNVDGRSLRDSFSFADGCLTKRGTFQKFFEQHELRGWIDRTLEASAVPAAPGIFYVFRDEQVRASFIATQYRRRRAVPRLTKSAELFVAHEGLLCPLMQFVTDQGRLPFDDELTAASSIVEVFGSIRKAFRVVLTVTDKERWEQIRRQRSGDLLVYLALSQFEGRTPFGRLPLAMQRDVKAFFGSHKKACAEADELLFSLGRPGVVDTASRQSPVGKLTPSALYVHESALPAISPLLRLYEGSARSYWGRVEGREYRQASLGRAEGVVPQLSGIR